MLIEHIRSPSQACPTGPSRVRMSFSRRPSDQPLSLIDISRWTVAPRQSLEDLLTLGRLDPDAIRTLSTLASVLESDGIRHAASVPSPEPVRQLVAQLENNMAVQVEHVEAALRWLDQAAAALRQIRRADFHHALNVLIRQAEERAVLHKLTHADL